MAAEHELVESEDHVEVNGIVFNKPFVEVSAASRKAKNSIAFGITKSAINWFETSSINSSILFIL